MGGAGSGGYKNSPGDVETHSAWDLIDPLPGGFQVPKLACPRHSFPQHFNTIGYRNYVKQNASIAAKRWHSTRPAKEPIYSPVKHTLMP